MVTMHDSSFQNTMKRDVDIRRDVNVHVELSGGTTVSLNARYAEVLLHPSFSQRHGSRRLHPQVFVRQCLVFKRHDFVSGRLDHPAEELTASAASAMKIKGGYSTRRHRPHCRRQTLPCVATIRRQRWVGGKPGKPQAFARVCHVVARTVRSDIEALAHLTDFTAVDEHGKSTSCSLVIVNH